MENLKQNFINSKKNKNPKVRKILKRSIWCCIIANKNYKVHQSVGSIPNEKMLNQQVYAFKPLTDIAKSSSKEIVSIFTSISSVPIFLYFYQCCVVSNSFIFANLIGESRCFPHAHNDYSYHNYYNTNNSIY